MTLPCTTGAMRARNNCQTSQLTQHHVTGNAKRCLCHECLQHNWNRSSTLHKAYKVQCCEIEVVHLSQRQAITSQINTHTQQCHAAGAVKVAECVQVHMPGTCNTCGSRPTLSRNPAAKIQSHVIFMTGLPIHTSCPPSAWRHSLGLGRDARQYPQLPIDCVFRYTCAVLQLAVAGNHVLAKATLHPQWSEAREY